MKKFCHWFHHVVDEQLRNVQAPMCIESHSDDCGQCAFCTQVDDRAPVDLLALDADFWKRYEQAKKERQVVEQFELPLELQQ
jgi:hypothetical protein